MERRRIDGTYDEYCFRHPLETALTNLSNESWVSAPASAGTAWRWSPHAELPRRLNWADVVIVEHPWQFAACKRLKPNARFVLSSHNMEGDKLISFAESRGRPFGWRAWARFVERAERTACQSAELIYTVSEADRLETSERYGVALERILAVPNSADCSELRPTTAEERRTEKRRLGLPDKPIVVFAQGTSQSAGMPAFRWVERVAAVNDRVHFLTAGALFPKPERRANVTITGPVVDIRPYIRAADFAVCPVEFGAGTKTKLIEALCAGLPTVAFEQALRGFELTPEEHLLVAEPSVESLSSAFDRLLDDPQRAARIGAAGRSFVEANHDWDTHVDRLETALQDLASGHRRTQPSHSAIRSVVRAWLK